MVNNGISVEIIKYCNINAFVEHNQQHDNSGL